MVRLTKIYTKTGDDGLTGLVDGSRRPKYDLRVVAYGTVDEANAALGLAALYLEPPLSDMIKRLQNDLFDLGAELASPGETPRLHITPQQVERLERDIDTLNADLQPLDSFVLPGGHAGAAHLHLARTILRRAERQIVELADKNGEELGHPLRQYINRASDFVFVAARWANNRGRDDVLWQPGAGRDA